VFREASDEVQEAELGLLKHSAYERQTDLVAVLREEGLEQLSTGESCLDSSLEEVDCPASLACPKRRLDAAKALWLNPRFHFTH